MQKFSEFVSLYLTNIDYISIDYICLEYTVKMKLSYGQKQYLFS